MSTWKPHPAFEIEDKTPLHKILVWAKGKQEIIAVSFLVVLLVSVGIPYYLKSKAESESTGMQKLNDHRCVMLPLSDHLQHAHNLFVELCLWPFHTHHLGLPPYFSFSLSASSVPIVSQCGELTPSF